MDITAKSWKRAAKKWYVIGYNSRSILCALMEHLHRVGIEWEMTPKETEMDIRVRNVSAEKVKAENERLTSEVLTLRGLVLSTSLFIGYLKQGDNRNAAALMSQIEKDIQAALREDRRGVSDGNNRE